MDAIAPLIERFDLSAADVDAFHDQGAEHSPYARWADSLKDDAIVDLESVSREQAIHLVRRFLVSMTLKDSSVFLSMAVSPDALGAPDTDPGDIAALALERRHLSVRIHLLLLSIYLPAGALRIR